MHHITQAHFDEILKTTTNIKPRFKRDLRFVSSTEYIGDDWAEYEVVPIYDKAKRTGIVLLQPYDQLYVIAFESGGGVRDTASGRIKSVICDFCYTWRPGGDAGLVTFFPSSRTNNSTAQLSCFDLDCSRHARTQTKAAIMSRAQLREHMTDDERIDRLRRHLQKFIDKLQIHPIDDVYSN